MGRVFNLSCDLKWLYDTILPISECISILTNLPEINPNINCRFDCTQASDYMLEIVLRNLHGVGNGGMHRTRYTAEFYNIEKTQHTVMLLRFEDEMLGLPPAVPPDVMDDLFKETIQAYRRLKEE